jgi:DNA-binding NarL/FixJ family response regulator
VTGTKSLLGVGASMMVVDSDAEQRNFVEGLLRRGGWPVETYSSGEQALAAAARTTLPLVALVEVRLSGISGYEVCRELKERYRDRVAVIFMSHDRTEPSDVEAGLLLGADEYLAKPLRQSELRARVLAVLRRLRPSKPDRRPDRRGDLTPRELEVLQLLARGLDQTEIAERLVISPKTVGKHIEHILDKLPAHSRAEAVAIAYQRDLHDENVIELHPGRL